MAPPRTAADGSEMTGTHPIDRTPEYEEFMARLREFHAKRGTNLDPEPKLGLNHVDLFRLFNYIVERGGYDKVSDEKLAWRRMCEGLGLMTSNPPAAAFGLKSIFYKNLAAFEIKTIHNKEPPPPEILEHITARGSGLLTRTLETYKTNRRETVHERSDGDDGTPVRDRKPEDTPGSARASRGLREAPPQRIIFQPDTAPPRQARHTSGQHATPAAHSSPHPQSHANSHTQIQPPHLQAMQHHAQRGGPSHAWNPSAPELHVPAVQNYQPGELLSTPTRIVPTPISNPEEFARSRRHASMLAAGRPVPDPMQPRLPGTGSEGPNIYLRCVTALRSGIQSEQAFGLHHLVKISFERGEKFRFEQFPGLADGLAEKALEVGNLFYDVNWSISFERSEGEGPIGELDGVDGTLDILDRIAQLTPKDVQDSIIPAEFSDRLVLITEAMLTIRNMAMLYDNAVYLSEYPTLKDLLCIILHLPRKELVVELKHFALDIAEQVTPNFILDSDDPLYRTLLAQLDSNDRGCILTSLRAIGRVSMNLAQTNKLGGVPVTVLQDVMNWLLLNDDELLDACLDFLYQYTAVVSNVDTLLKVTKVENLVSHLVRLLSHGAKRENREFVIEGEKKVPGGEFIVEIPKDLFERLLASEEPERCYQWLRCLFEEDADSHITQIAVWQAYTNAFLEPLKKSGRNLINAAEFIRNISQVYQSAGAQIVRDQGPMGEVNRFIIRGIRPRPRPISPDGREYFRCLWTRDDPQPGGPLKCGVWFVSAEAAYDHVLEHHLSEERGEDNRFDNREAKFSCQWADCRKYLQPTKMHLTAFMSHVKTHLVAEERKCNAQHNTDVSQTPGGSTNSNKRAKRPYVRPARTISITSEETLTIRDERNPNATAQAGGIPLSAILVLRNIARNVVKTEAEEELLKLQEGGDESGGWNERLFRPMSARLYEIMAENKYLAPHISSLLQLLEF